MAITEVWDIQPIEARRGAAVAVGSPNAWMGDYSPGRVGLVFTTIQRVTPPIPARGMGTLALAGTAQGVGGIIPIERIAHMSTESRWDQLGNPTVEVMLDAIAARDERAATAARAVWDILQRHTPHERDEWREQMSTAVLSYRGVFGRSRIYAIAVQRLIELTGWQA